MIRAILALVGLLVGCTPRDEPVPVFEACEAQGATWCETVASCPGDPLIDLTGEQCVRLYRAACITRSIVEPVEADQLDQCLVDIDEQGCDSVNHLPASCDWSEPAPAESFDVREADWRLSPATHIEPQPEPCSAKQELVWNGSFDGNGAEDPRRRWVTGEPDQDGNVFDLPDVPVTYSGTRAATDGDDHSTTYIVVDVSVIAHVECGGAP